MLKGILFGLILFVNLASNAQVIDDFFTYFRLEKTQQQVFISWELKEGNTCHGIEVQRATDSLNFEKIYEIPGICGDSTTPKPYNYLDETPVLNSLNYYRIYLGNQGYSSHLSLYVLALDPGESQIYPHPVTSSSVLIFNKPNNAECYINIYDVKGKLEHSIPLYSELFEIKDLHLSTGLWIYTITGNDCSARGKLIIP